MSVFESRNTGNKIEYLWLLCCIFVMNKFMFQKCSTNFYWIFFEYLTATPSSHALLSYNKCNNLMFIKNPFSSLLLSYLHLSPFKDNVSKIQYSLNIISRTLSCYKLNQPSSLLNSENSYEEDLKIMIWKTDSNFFYSS